MTNSFTDKTTKKVILGIDIGTSGVRGCIVERMEDSKANSQPFSKDRILIEHQVSMPIPNKNSINRTVTQPPSVWIDALENLLFTMKQGFSFHEITHIILDATSSTVLLQDFDGKPVCDALMYNDNQSIQAASEIDKTLTTYNLTSGAVGASSTLAKVMNLLQQNNHIKQVVICHQIDFLNHYLGGIINITDENNALKLGYDSVNHCWPTWIPPLLNKNRLESSVTLPNVVKPGSYLANILPSIAQKFGFSESLKLMAGTTDSIAGFLASGASWPGDCVSSLGSTLAIKMIAKQPVFHSDFGIYSHKLFDYWLIGGASNSGGQVILNFYNIEQIQYLENQISNQNLDDLFKNKPPYYYPLIQPGERFPICDAELKPILPKQPNKPFEEAYQSKEVLQQHIDFYLGLLLGLSQVERLSYDKLTSLGALVIKQIFSVGGGTKNKSWMQIRNRTLDSKMSSPINLHAAYGVTRLIR
jgi:sugar (pentulose or hexulose) kinase